MTCIDFNMESMIIISNEAALAVTHLVVVVGLLLLVTLQ